MTAMRNRLTHPRLGDQTACRVCYSDIEYHGPRGTYPREHVLHGLQTGGWTDRGGNHFCDESGAAKWDENGSPVRIPHKRHMPYSDARS